MEKIIGTRDLYTNFYTYEGAVKALNGISISMNQGETYGLVGESGCGKSVSVRSLMRIVQAPGRIESGNIFLFMDQKDRSKGIDIVTRSEAYMESIRWNDMSMIFQEAGTSLNPVLSIEEQIAESFYFHRHAEMVEETKKRLSGLIAVSGGLKRLTIKRKLNLLQKELASLERYDVRVAEIDRKSWMLDTKTDRFSRLERSALNSRRDKLRKYNWTVRLQRKIPFIRSYRKDVKKVIRENIIRLLTELGIPNPGNVIQRYPHELSGGMQQRIVIAIALACHPQVLIADEPTSNLDVTIQAQILDLIKELKKTKISSVLFITHDLGVVAEICDRVTVMYAGDVCETAEVKELFKNPCHPYTKGLLASVPRTENSDKLESIPGIVPNLVNPPTGCRFHPRCPYAMEICKSEKPAVFIANEGHSVACHLFSQKGNADE